MKQVLWAVLLGCWGLQALGEAEVKSRVESVSLFKNGLAVVHRAVQLPGSGRYVVRDLPAPVHGTFRIASEAPLRARVTMREIDVPNVAAGIDLRRELAGLEVELVLEERAEPVRGRVLPPPAAPEEAWNRRYEQPNPHNYSSWWYRQQQGAARGQLPPRFLVLQTPGGLTYVDQAAVRLLEVRGSLRDRQEEQSVLVLETDREGPQPVTLTYLTKGLAWAPSYQVDLGDGQLTLTQQAVIRNELTDLDGAAVTLISGFPHIEFGHVDSPMAAATSWTQFFQQLNARPGQHQSMVTQQAMVVSNGGMTIAPQFTMGAEGHSADLHYHDLGTMRLAAGEVLALTTATATAPMRRIVDWTVPDNREWDGSFVPEHRRRESPETYEDVAWDAVEFANPFDFPMTTAPASIFENGRFRGQTQSFWINPGQEGTLRVTKALSIVTRATEQEVQENGRRDNDYVHVGGRRFRRATVEGKLYARNHRPRAVEMVIRRRFSGDLLEAAGAPSNDLWEEGVYSINPRHELTWTRELGAGEDLELTYRYQVLIPH